MSDAVAAEKKENTCCLMKILQNVVYLGRPGLALRGDGDDKSGNFYRLMSLRILDDPSLLEGINRSYDRHMSSKSQNEILKLVSSMVAKSQLLAIMKTAMISILQRSIDNVTETIKNRFDQPDYQMYINIV